VRLVKYLDSLRIGPSKDNSPTPARGGRPRQQTEPVEYEIRRMRPNEAIEISRTVFQSYGYSYANEFVYYPDRIAAMNQSGQMLSAVAVLRETGEIAGHSALLFNNDLPAEVAVAVTKPEFRGQGIARRLGEYLEGQACNMGLKGLYMKEVTVHPYTQKFAEKLGFRDCGMLLAHSPKTLSFKGIADEPSQRNSDVLGFRLIADPPLRELYLPERHAAVISSLYNSLGIPLHPRSTKAVPDVTQKTVVKSVVSPLRSVCEIHFSRYGGDLLGMLKQELRRIRRQEVKLVEMYLRLTDPLTPWIVPQAEKMGFFFSGILPETPGGDSVILQYFNGIQVEYDELVIVRPGTAAVLEYIKTLDPTMA
jgi:GNAT superfamily N-acetyltransferase